MSVGIQDNQNTFPVRHTLEAIHCVQCCHGCYRLFFPGRSGSSTYGDSSIHHPPVVQHFMFEPVGYPNASSSHQISLSTGKPTPSSVGSNVRGYYEKDAKALREAIRNVPVYSNLPKIPPCSNDVPNATNGNSRTCSVPFPEEENETAAETCLPDEDLEGSTGDAIASETMQDFNTTHEKEPRVVCRGTVIVLDFRHGHDPVLRRWDTLCPRGGHLSDWSETRSRILPNRGSSKR